MILSGIFSSLSLALGSLWGGEVRRCKGFPFLFAPAENCKDRDNIHSSFDSCWFFTSKGLHGGCRRWQRHFASCSTLNLKSSWNFPIPSAFQLTLPVGQFLVVEDLALLRNTVHWPDLFLAPTLGCWAITCQFHLNVDLYILSFLRQLQKD